MNIYTVIEFVFVTTRKNPQGNQLIQMYVANLKKERCNNTSRSKACNLNEG
jgi:hypothetical protein